MATGRQSPNLVPWGRESEFTHRRMKTVSAELRNEWTCVMDAAVKLRNAHLHALASVTKTLGPHGDFDAIDAVLSLEPLTISEMACDNANDDLEDMGGAGRAAMSLAFLRAVGAFRLEVVVFENKIRTNTALIEQVILSEGTCKGFELVKDAAFEYRDAVDTYNKTRRTGLTDLTLALCVVGTPEALKAEHKQAEHTVAEAGRKRPREFDDESSRRLALALGSARKRLFN